MIDRGFEAMIPRSSSKQEEQDDIFKYDIILPLFGRVFTLTIKIKNQEWQGAADPGHDGIVVEV